MCARLTLPAATSERASRPPQIGSNSDQFSPDPNSMLTASPKRCSLQGHHYSISATLKRDRCVWIAKEIV
jgi:hypothetical protein